jgi:hypothetical protein
MNLHYRRMADRGVGPDLWKIERQIGGSPWRDLLKELRHDRGWFAAAIGDKSARRGLTSLETMQ